MKKEFKLMKNKTKSLENRQISGIKKALKKRRNYHSTKSINLFKNKKNYKYDTQINNSNISILSNANINIIKVLNNYINEDFKFDSVINGNNDNSVDNKDKKDRHSNKSSRFKSKKSMNLKNKNHSNNWDLKSNKNNNYTVGSNNYSFSSSSKYNNKSLSSSSHNNIFLSSSSHNNNYYLLESNKTNRPFNNFSLLPNFSFNHGRMEFEEKPKNLNDKNNKTNKYSSHIGFNDNRTALKLMKLTKNIEQKPRATSRSILFYEEANRKNKNNAKIIQLIPCKRVDSFSNIEYEVNNNFLGYINELEIMKINKNIHNDINFIKLKNKISKLKKTMRYKSTKKIKIDKSSSKRTLDSINENDKKTENSNETNSNKIYNSNLMKRTYTKFGKNEKYRVMIRKKNLYDSFDDEEGKEEEIGFYLSPNYFLRNYILVK